MRLIDAEALYDTLEREYKRTKGDTHSAFRECINYLCDAPTIDAVPMVWESVDGFEGLYFVNKYGQVKNKKGKIMKQQIKRTSGTCYKSVDLWKDGRYYKKYVHRLVAEKFIKNPNGLEFVNHKDEDGTNNIADNLEWCTREYNVNYGTARERRIKKIKGVPHTEEHKAKIANGLKQYYSEHDVWNKGKPQSPYCGCKMDTEDKL